MVHNICLPAGSGGEATYKPEADFRSARSAGHVRGGGPGPRVDDFARHAVLQGAVDAVPGHEGEGRHPSCRAAGRGGLHRRTGQ